MAVRTFKMRTPVEPLSLLARGRRVAEENGATAARYHNAGAIGQREAKERCFS